uniref:Ribitol-5-phosphate transferase FKTN N-terminal domain-containing protein n=1 Tax=Spermophilus dauricus TaxID=99837 RepID=A0A8C9QBF4_SPEDA
NSNAWVSPGLHPQYHIKALLTLTSSAFLLFQLYYYKHYLSAKKWKLREGKMAAKGVHHPRVPRHRAGE